MSFKSIPVEKKIKAVSGEKIQPVAREIGVQRASIYTWRERTLSTLKEALEPHKRGRVHINNEVRSLIGRELK